MATPGGYFEERDLLLGILAMQFKGLTPEQLHGALTACAAAASGPLDRYLVSAGLLEPQDSEFLNLFANEALRAHNGDIADVLESFGGAEEIRQVYCGNLDNTFVARMSTIPMPDLSLSSRPPRKTASGLAETPGRYTFLSRQGRGGMGRVLVVHDQYLGRSVALKELLPFESKETDSSRPTPVRHTASIAARFLQEARITGQLEHPSIVPVYELGHRCDGTLYYTMKLVRGKTLAQALKESDNLKDRLKLLHNFIDLCQAIAYAHSRRVIHRDIKPGNVMVGQFGETILLDWGLAKVKGKDDVNMTDMEEAFRLLRKDVAALPETAYGKALGTPQYMAPEQAEGDLDAIDESSDVYSLGAVLYEFLTGYPPYTGNSTKDVIERVVSTSPPPILVVAPDAPPELAAICHKAMSRNKMDRYESAAALADDVTNFVTGSLVGAYKYSPSETLRFYYRKHRLAFKVGIVSLVILGISLTYSYVSIVRAWSYEAHARREIEQAKYVSDLKLAQAYLQKGDSTMANEILLQAQESQRGWEWGYLMRDANSCALSVASPGSAIYSCIFSSNGKLVAALANDRPPSLWQVDTGKLAFCLERVGQTPHYICCRFDPQDAQIAAADTSGVVRLWAVETGEMKASFQASEPICDICFDDTGTRLAAGCSNGVIEAWTVASGEHAVINGHHGSFDRLCWFPKTNILLAETAGDTEAWDVEKREIVYRLSGRFGAVSPASLLIATLDKTDLCLWDFGTGKLTKRCTGHKNNVCTVSFNAEGTQALTAANEAFVLLWDVKEGQVIRALPASEPITSAAFALNGKYTVMCDRKNILSLCDTYGSPPILTLRGTKETSRVVSTPFSVSSDTTRLAFACGDNAFRLWNLSSIPGMEVLYYPDELTMGQIAPKCLHSWLSPDGEKFAVCVAVMGIIVGSTEKKGGATLFQAPISVGDPRAFAFGPTAETLAMVLDGQTVLVWNCKSNSIISVYNKHRGPVNSVAFSPDGQEVISASDDATAHIWDPNTGEMTAELRGHTGEVQSASFSPDGNLILTVSTDGTGILWERRHLARIATLEGKQGPISAASFSSNGNRIVTLTSNGYGSLWTSPEGQHLGSFRTSEDLSLCQAAEFTSADKTFLTRTSTGTSLWDSDSLKFLFNSETQDNIHLFPDHSVLSVSTQGVVARRNLEVPIPSSRCTASSYEITTFPSEGGLSIENNSPARDMVTVIPMGTDDFISILKLLTACIERPDNSPGQGLPLDACVRLSPLSHMRFRASDIITHINGVSLGPDGAALRLLYDLNAHTDGAQKNCSLRLTLLRNGVPINFVCQSWPVTTQSETARVEPEAAREFIDTQRQLFLQNESLWSEKGGVTLTGQTVDTWRDSFLIWPYDVLIKLDNTDISLASHGRDPFKELAEGIAGGQVKEFKETLQRGQFLQVSIIYSVS